MFYVILFSLLFTDIGLAAAILRDEPTIVETARLFSYSFVLIVFIESFFLQKYLKELRKTKAVLISLQSNLFCLFVIIPVVWGGWMTIIELFLQRISDIIPLPIQTLLSAPWITTKESILGAEWVMIPAYFLASYYGEYLFCRRNLKEYRRETIKKAFFYANLWSYLAIMLVESVYRYFIGY